MAALEALSGSKRRAKDESQGPQAISLQRYRNPADVGGELHSRLWTSQRDDDALLIPELNASGATNEGAAGPYGAVGTGKIADLPDA